MSSPNRTLFIAVIVALLPVGNALAQITRFDLEVVESPALGGRHFGEVGQYERLRASWPARSTRRIHVTRTS